MPHHVHSADELRLLVMQARAHGTLDETDSAMLAGVFDFHEKKAYDVMRPRTEVAALDIDSTEEEVWAVVRRERYSRYPVYRDTLDDVLGVFLAKDLWLHDGQQAFALKDFVRPALYVPSSKPAERVMDDLRKTRAQMAVVLDEYGGTAGILTMEDLVEEVVGDITDEYDFASRRPSMTDGVLELAGSLSLVDVRSDYGLRIPEGDWTTLGGYAFGRLGRLPKIGDRVPFPGGELEIIALEGRRVAGLRVHRRQCATRWPAAERSREPRRTSAWPTNMIDGVRVNECVVIPRDELVGARFAGGRRRRAAREHVVYAHRAAMERGRVASAHRRAARARDAETFVATGRRAEPCGSSRAIDGASARIARAPRSGWRISCAQALIVPKKRRPTKPSRAAKQARLGDRSGVWRHYARPNEGEARRAVSAAARRIPHAAGSRA